MSVIRWRVYLAATRDVGDGPFFITIMHVALTCAFFWIIHLMMRPSSGMASEQRRITSGVQADTCSSVYADAGAIIAQGTVREVIANHGAPAIEIIVTGDAAAAFAAVADHGVVERTEGNAVWVVPTAGVAPLLAAIEGTGATIVKLSLGDAGLEAAFLALTGRALRDDE